MAELAAGAVHSLLGLIRNEALLLDSVRTDVQFIKEEMESMNSFLLHLARTAPPGGEHDEQVRTWMKQVRDLAHDCSNCIDLYLQRGDPEIHRARGLRGYASWVVWFVQKFVAQHRAAAKLRELKNRARDVGERRLRYGVEVPSKAAAGQASGPGATTSPSFQSEPAHERDEEDDHKEPATPIDDSDRRALAFSETRILEDWAEKLVKWLDEDAFPLKKDAFLPSIAIAAQDIGDAYDIAHEALATDFKSNVKVIDIAEVSFQRPPQDPLNILNCILGKLLHQSHQEDTQMGILDDIFEKFLRSTTKIMAKIAEIEDNIQKHLTDKSEKEATGKALEEENTATASSAVPLGKLLLQLLHPEPEQPQDKSVKEAALEEGNTVKETARKLKEHMEEDESETPLIALDPTQYVHILWEVFPPPKPKDKEYMRKQMMKFTQEIPHGEHRPKPREVKSVEELKDKITEKIREIHWRIEEQLLIKLFVDKIKPYLLSNRTLIILQYLDQSSGWKKISHALSLLCCADGSAVIVTTNNTEEAKEFCYPKQEPIICSFVGLYHDKVLQLIKPQMKDHHAQIFRDILDKCEPHEFCMQIFACALYANPNRSPQELQKLKGSLVRQGPLGRNAKRMFKFSYNDLPREYKVCLLYLAIFPRGHNFKRSTLIGRWVVEGLITKEDWPGSVRQAERCFDELVDRLFVYPGDIGAAGKVKSCVVHDLVHEFISKIAKKEHFVDTRLSHHLARHFSILSGIQLRSSDSIDNFLRKLSKSPELPLLRVLYLEGCQCFKDRRYLKNICSKMLLLKYLSLRGTNITQLPNEINKLHQLEILDIQQTKVPESATKHVLLLKLKRLLAGGIDPSSTDTDIVKAEESFSSVRVPHRIEKMTDIEVLSNVKASWDGHELKDIGKLWQLRKLGVVIHDKKAHLENLVQAIGDLNECLQSLSISIKPLQASSQDAIILKNSLKLLESLSISGITHSGKLLPTLVKHSDQLAKVTLHDTHLKQDNMKDLGGLPKLRCVRLRHESYIERNLTFKKDEFETLKYFLVEGYNMTEIIFQDGAAPQLEKIVLSSTNMNSISFGHRAAPKLEEIALPSTNITSITFKNGATPNLTKTVLSFNNIECLSRIDNLKGLKEIELNGSGITRAALLSLFTNANHIAKVTLRDTLLWQDDLQILAKQPNIRWLILLEKSFNERQLTFNKDEFPKLNLLIVKCPDITNISFTDGAARKLEKIVWSFTKMESLSGIGKLLKLKDIEFNGDLVPYRVRKAIKEHSKQPDFKHNKPQTEDTAKGSATESSDAARFPFFWKNWGRC